MKPIRILLLLSAVCCCLCVSATPFSYTFNSTPLSEALSKIAREHPEINLNFIYNHIENFRTSAKIDTDDPYSALRKTVGNNPVSVVRDGNVFYLEARQKGRHTYYGRVTDHYGTPLPGAAVILLSPSDSTAITYSVTDERGRFSIPCDRQGIIIKTSAMGYHTRYTRPKSTDTGDITMKENPVRLDNITVKADNSWFTRDKTVFLPSKREKNAARGGNDLLFFMAIPQLTVNPVSNSISTQSGEGVQTYIDYVRASSEDLANLRTQDVEKVEIYDYPDDPRFEGARHVVNFILVKYEYGGYTKLRGFQWFNRESGDYAVSSKLTVKNTTLDIAAGAEYTRTTKKGSRSVAEYEFHDMETVRTEETEQSLYRRNSQYVSARASTVTDKMTVTNTVGINFTRTPDNNYESNESFTNYYESGKSVSMRDTRNIMPYWNGQFHFFLPHSLSLSVSPELSYSRNSNRYAFSYGQDKIRNVAKENAWYALAAAKLSKKFSKHTLSISLAGEFSDNKIRYTGTSPADVHYRQKAIGTRVEAFLNFGNITVSPSVKYYISSNGFDGFKRISHLPSYFVSARWMINRKNSLNLNSEMSNWTIPENQLSPNIVLRNRIDAVQGNPKLGTYLFNSATANYGWFPLGNLSLSAFVRFENYHRPIDYTYEPIMIDGNPMMLQSYVKDGDFANLNSGLSANLRLFDNSLALYASVTDKYSRRTGINRFSANNIVYVLQARYYLGDFYFSVFYRNRTETLYTMGQRSTIPAYLQFRAGWSHNGLNVTFSADNPFSGGWEESVSSCVYPNYAERTVTYGDTYHRSFSISLSYSFSYGKKVNYDNELQKANSMNSGIVE